MWPESNEQVITLKTGLTTGTCATACCMAAAQGLLANKFPEAVDVQLPKGKIVRLQIESYETLNEGRCIRASTIKDAGDDPDVTHGATVFVELSLSDVPLKEVEGSSDVAEDSLGKVEAPSYVVEDSPDIIFKSARGVGTVTREGLVLPVGEPAINPVPRRMMSEHLRKSALTYRYQGGFEVAIGIENGENIALKTMNPRLGIVGGLSILGTTGIVRPYSCSAYIASIHQGIDVARANGISHIAATTGSTSEAAIKAHYHLHDMALIEMGDFVGAVLKHLRHRPIKRVSLCGGFGKMTKLANGHMDLNSRASAIDFEQLANWAQECGASPTLQSEIRSANTSMQALSLCQQQQIELGSVVCQKALKQARQVLSKLPLSELSLEVWVVDRQGHFVGSAIEALR